MMQKRTHSLPHRSLFLLYWLACNLLHVSSTQWQHATTTTAENTRKPVIVVPPRDVFSTDGVLEFSCQADGVPKPLINWYDANTGDLVIDRTPSGGSSAGIHVNQHYGRLMVSNPIRGTIYSFYCNASNVVGWVISEPPVQGALAFLETKFRKVPSDDSVPEGSRVTLECEPPKGLPKPHVSWLYQGQPILPHNDTGVYVTKQGGLQIFSAATVHSGVYVCVATNVAGEQRSPPMTLQVETRARFIETPKDTRVRQGSDVKFRCRVEGNRLVQWSKDRGRGLIDSSRAELADGYLLLKNVQLVDAGTYVCTAPGSITAHAVLTVETPPTFARTPDDLTIYEGQTAVFRCVTSGFPQPSIYWELADKTPVFPSDQGDVMRLNQRFYLHPDGNLEIRNVQKSDAGRYQCTAHSSVDRIHSTANLRVVSRPTDQSEFQVKVGDVPSPSEHILVPIIGLPPANQTRMVGELVVLDCELGIQQAEAPNEGHANQASMKRGSGLRPADWQVNWQRITGSTLGVAEHIGVPGQQNEQRLSVLPGGSLQIYDIQLSDAGAYICIVETLADLPSGDTAHLRSNWTAVVNVRPRDSTLTPDRSYENPLSPPRNVRALNITESTVTLAWDPSHWVEIDSIQSGGRSIFEQPRTAYWVEYYRPDLMQDGWQVVEQNWQANMMKIGNLQPNTAYYFLIRPRLEFGRVGWAGAPIGPVFTLPIKYKPDSHVQLETDLSKPLVNKELIAAVKKVELRAIQLQTLTPQSVKVSWSIHERPELIVLLSGYTINYRQVSILQCVTVSMDERRIETPLAADDYCSLQSNEAYAHLHQMQINRQSAVAEDASAVATQSVSVKTQFLDNEPIFNTDQLVTYERSGLIRDLQPFRCYEVSVKAYLTHGLLGNIEGRESVSRSVLTFESFPGAPPTEIAAQWISHQDIELTWEPPPATVWNGLLLGYVIYVYDEVAVRHETFNVSMAERRTRIKGLIGPEAYLLQMAAMTCKGVGVRSKPLKLDPKFRRKGLGVGWQFDPSTGLRLSKPALTSHLGVTAPRDTLTNQPWFIGLVISSLALWCILIVLVVYCCRRQRFTMRKSTGGVLIANTSNCGSTNGDLSSSRTTSMSITKAQKSNSRHPEDTSMTMLPLLSKQEIENPGVSHNSYSMVAPPEDQHAYGLYSVANGDLQWTNYTADTIPNRPTVFRGPLQLGENSPAFPGHDSSTRMPSMVSVDMTNVNSARCGSGVGVVNSMNFVSNCSPMLSNYLTYQPTLLPLSQSISEFQNCSNNHEPATILPTCTNGQYLPNCLPMIAPVARLGNHVAPFTLRNGSPMLDSMEPTATSVTPYATASIVKPRLFSQHVSSKHGVQDVADDAAWTERNRMLNENAKKHECKGPSGNASYTSSDGSNSYGSSRVSNDEQQIGFGPDERLCRMYQSNDGHGMPQPTSLNAAEQHMLLRRQRGSTPQRAHNPILVDVRTTSSNKSKSDSSGSSKTGTSDLSRNKICHDTLNQGPHGSISPQSYNHDEHLEGSVYSLIDDSIPPPPASPPPPAPMSRTKGSYGIPQSGEIQSSRTDHVRLLHSELVLDGNRDQMTVYDTNAETTEDEDESEEFRPTSGVPASRVMNRPQPPFCVNASNGDPSRNSTYAQVY